MPVSTRWEGWLLLLWLSQEWRHQPETSTQALDIGETNLDAQEMDVKVQGSLEDHSSLPKINI